MKGGRVPGGIRPPLYNVRLPPWRSGISTQFSSMASKKSSSRLPVLLCDLDGTLIDTIPLILQGYVHTLQQMGRGAVSEELVSEHLSMPLREPMSQWFTDEQECERSVAICREYVLAAHDASVRAFPGVLQALGDCLEQGVRLGVVTSKTRAIAERGLELTGMTDFFEVFVGGGYGAWETPSRSALKCARHNARCAGACSLPRGHSRRHASRSGRRHEISVGGLGSAARRPNVHRTPHMAGLPE
jgi:pyrophosphatase PpaX